jgi:hypothetical protein
VQAKSSKQAAGTVVDSLVGAPLFSYASVGAALPGLGKLVLRQIPLKPARTIVSFGKEIKGTRARSRRARDWSSASRRKPKRSSKNAKLDQRFYRCFS